MFDFKRAIVFCLGYRFSKHRMIKDAKILGCHSPWAPPGYAYGSQQNCLNFQVNAGKNRKPEAKSKLHFFTFYSLIDNSQNTSQESNHANYTNLVNIFMNIIFKLHVSH